MPIGINQNQLVPKTAKLLWLDNRTLLTHGGELLAAVKVKASISAGFTYQIGYVDLRVILRDAKDYLVRCIADHAFTRVGPI